MRLSRTFNTNVYKLYIFTKKNSFINVFSERSRSRSQFVVAHPSVVCLSVCRVSVCLSVMFVRPTQAVQIFGNISTALGTVAIH